MCRRACHPTWRCGAFAPNTIHALHNGMFDNRHVYVELKIHACACPRGMAVVAAQFTNISIFKKFQALCFSKLKVLVLLIKNINDSFANPPSFIGRCEHAGVVYCLCGSSSHFWLCAHGIDYIVEVLRIPLGICSKAPSVKCMFFVMLYVRGNYGQFFNMCFFEKPRVT